MSRNLDPRIDAYIAKSAAFAQPILKKLRERVHRGCPDVTETMKWSMPHFEHAGKILCGMAGFKAHCTFHFWHQGMVKVLSEHGAQRNDAMGNFGRITSLDDLPDDKSIIGFVRAAVKLSESGAPGRPRPARGAAKELAVPASLAAGLRRNRAAGATFAKLSPSQRKEYIRWITEAKRDETRRQRLATALQWLSEGKPRHWKYLDC
jgi:uncharacterized protein YdeI (YjbR/CyaY-like superfamily)